MSDDKTKALKRVAKEVKKLPADGKEGEDNFTITPNHGDNALVWQVVMKGPAKYQVGEEERACPYAGREFTALLTFPDNYPFKNPSIVFQDIPYHPGIVPEGKEAGEVCERAISDFWAPTRKAVDFLNHIYTLLANPSAEDSMNGPAAEKMRTDIAAFEAAAAKSGRARS